MSIFKIDDTKYKQLQHWSNYTQLALQTDQDLQCSSVFITLSYIFNKETLHMEDTLQGRQCHDSNSLMVLYYILRKDICEWGVRRMHSYLIAFICVFQFVNLRECVRVYVIPGVF